MKKKMTPEFYRNIFTVILLLLLGSMSVTAQDTGINWYELDKAQTLAKENNKKVLIFVEASWCHNYKKMKQKTFPREEIRQTMETIYYPVK